MRDGSDQLVELLRPTPVVLAHEVWQGGHDYAWWRHGLSAALDRLDATTCEGSLTCGVKET
jgi:enterochelin esterase-like enzyme